MTRELDLRELPANPSERRPDIDALRVGATYLLFVFHVAKVFDPAPFYHIRNNEVSGAFYIVAGFISLWHMPLFFLLAGWSARASLAVRGAGGFAGERVRRLLMPLIAGCVLFGPLFKYCELRSGLDLNYHGLRVSAALQQQLLTITGHRFDLLAPFHESFMAFVPTYFTHLERFTWGHLWFIAYLFTISLAWLPLLRLIGRGPIKTTRNLALWLYSPLVALALIQVTLRGRWPGIYNLYNDWANVAFYSVFFVAGFVIAANPRLEARCVAERWRAFALAVLAMLTELAGALGLVKAPWILLVASAVAAWSFNVALLGFAEVWLRRPWRHSAYFTESAFPVYILHQPVIVAIGFFLVRLPLAILPKFVLLLTSSVLGTMLLYEALRRLQPARLLLGMKPLACPLPKAKKLATAALLLLLLPTPSAHAETSLKATLYEIGSHQTVVLFQWELERDPRHWRSQYRTPAGDLFAADDVAWERERFTRYEYKRPPVDETARVERRDGKVIYTQVMGGRTRTAVEDDSLNYTVGPTLIRYVQSEWPSVLAGRRLITRYGVPDMLRSFEFEIQRDYSRPESSQGDVVVRIRPRNPFLRWFVDPVYLVLTNDGQALHKLIGRVLPMERRKGKFHPFDAEMVVQP
jgi:fucose 4-O-acetylase-like acetyltransferase